MTLLPIVVRELRLAARHPRTYRVRLVAVVMALVFAWPAWLAAGAFAGAGAGKSMFLIFSRIAFLYCLIGGALATADCLSSEKRQGTMGFLFLTDLRGYDVVLGKLFSSTVRWLYALLAAVPILAAPILRGGVRPSEFWGEVLVLLNTLFFAASVGIMVSAFSKRERRAQGVAVVVLIALGLVLPHLINAVRSLAPLGAWARIVESFSVGHLQEMALIGRLSGDFWVTLLITHAMAWAFLGLASIAAPRTWQERPAGLPRLKWQERWRQWTLGSPEWRRRKRSRFLSINAWYWLASRGRWTPLGPWLVIVPVAVLAGWVWWRDPMGMRDSVLLVFAMIVIHAALKFGTAASAAEALVAHRREGTFELLLATPLTVRDVVTGQWLALRRQYLAALVGAMALQVAFWMLTIHWDVFVQKAREEFAGWTVACVLSLLMLVADLWALGWLGMWGALAAKRTDQAAGYALAPVLFLPWVAFLAIIVLVGLLSVARPLPFDPGFVWYAGLWFLLGIVTDVLVVLWSRRQLYRHFRVKAFPHYQPEALGWLACFGRWAGHALLRRFRKS